MQFRNLVLSAGVLVAISAISANANLTHLYTFNNGTANDSIGEANGTLVNGATVSNGQLQFDPGVNNGSNNPVTGQYVALPFNVAKTPSFTFEFWATDRSSTPWQRLIDLNNGTGSFQMFASGSTPANQGPLGQVSVNGTDFVTTSIHPTLNVEHQYVYTFDAVNHTNTIYIDGVFGGQNPAGASSPANSNFVNFWIGKSPFGADPYFDGTIDEARIYDSALTSSQVSSDFTTGPVPVPEPAMAGVVIAGMLALRRRSR